MRWPCDRMEPEVGRAPRRILRQGGELGRWEKSMACDWSELHLSQTVRHLAMGEGPESARSS